MSLFKEKVSQRLLIGLLLIILFVKKKHKKETIFFLSGKCFNLAQKGSLERTDFLVRNAHIFAWASWSQPCKRAPRRLTLRSLLFFFPKYNWEFLWILGQGWKVHFAVWTHDWSHLTITARLTVAKVWAGAGGQGPEDTPHTRGRSRDLIREFITPPGSTI